MATTTMVFNHPEYGKLTTKIRDEGVYISIQDIMENLNTNPQIKSLNLNITFAIRDMNNLFDLENENNVFVNPKNVISFVNKVRAELGPAYKREILNWINKYVDWLIDYVIPKAKAYKEGYQNKPKVEKESKACSCGGNCKDKTLENKINELEKEISSLKEELKTLKPILDMISKIKSIGKI